LIGDTVTIMTMEKPWRTDVLYTIFQRVSTR